MTLPKLTYQPAAGPAIDVDFPVPLTRYQVRRLGRVRDAFETAGGVASIVKDEYFHHLAAEIERATLDATFMDAWVAAWSWLLKGGHFRFNRDPDATDAHTLGVLDSPLVAGQNGISLNPATYRGDADLSQRLVYRIISPLEGYEERITFQGAGAGFGDLVITAGKETANDYAVGDLVLDETADYFVGLVSLNPKTPVQEEPGLLMSFNLIARTSKGTSGFPLVPPI